MKAKLVKFLTCLALCLSGSLSIASIAPGVTPDQAQAIAREAYIYANPVADCYRIMYTYFEDKNNPEYKGAWNQVWNTARVYTPDDKAIQTPNSDTPYSWLV
jgi:hypothetical protein